MKKVQIILEVAEEEKVKYETLAKSMKLQSVEELLLKLLKEVEESHEERVDDIMTYVLNKNKELYQRLA
jgi:hypothetical protein